jgi:hypothetical protein
VGIVRQSIVFCDPSINIVLHNTSKSIFLKMVIHVPRDLGTLRKIFHSVQKSFPDNFEAVIKVLESLKR